MDGVALVTGGSRGIGRAIAGALAPSHGLVVLTYRANASAAGEVVEEIRAGGGDAVAVACDLSDPAAADGLVAQVAAEHGGVDTLVNNAGGVRRRAFLDLDLAEFVEALHLHLTSVFALTRAVAPGMAARGGGVVVNIGSPVSGGGSVLGAHYAASKAGLVGLTRQAAAELAPAGIRVNLVEPAGVETDLVRDLEAGDPGVVRVPPIGRLGQPSDVAEVVAFLCSDRASFVSGASVLVSGAR